MYRQPMIVRESGAMTTATSPLTLEVVPKGECIVVHLNGKLIAGVGDQLHSQVCLLLPKTKRIVLDLTNLTRVDSMGLGTLVRCYVSARGTGVSLELVNLGKQIRQLLGTTGLMSVFVTIGENNIKLC
jgi:anti-sigma B factor antagonist